MLPAFFSHEMDVKWINNPRLWDRLQTNELSERVIEELLGIVRNQKANNLKIEIRGETKSSLETLPILGESFIQEWQDSHRRKTSTVEPLPWRQNNGHQRIRRKRETYPTSASSISSDSVLTSTRKQKPP
jgi:hypothetical protein